MSALKMNPTILKSALTKSHALFNALSLRTRILSIFTGKCIKCIKSPQNNIQILWYKSSIGANALYALTILNCDLSVSICKQCIKEAST
jgi:hypothetical protein